MDADAHQKLTSYIATFWTHLAALSTLKALQANAVQAVAGPVPRKLSASCGVCVRYEASDPCLSLMHRDFDKIVTPAGDGYQTVAENHEAC